MKRSCIGMVFYLLLLFVGLPAYCYATDHPALRAVVGPVLLALIIGLVLVIGAELRRR
jgi:hypothetical protein